MRRGGFWALLALGLCLSITHTLAKPKPDPRAHGESADPTNVNVRTKWGEVVGFVEKLDALNRPRGDIEQANIFLGIPYAKPPVGTLRFEKPEAPEPWDEPLEALSFAPGCAPHHPIAGFDYDEDCLHLNVFAPHRPAKNDSLYPVLVFIHGGGFCTGSASQYGFANVSDNLVSQGIVVVTIQYRLGMLGFLSNGDLDLPGNLGLWDQRQALVWVQENIRAFGGDPERVTLYGQSAGAASTSMLSLSHHSRDLFHQMIIHSGSHFSHWASNEHVVEMSRDWAKQAGCPIDDSKKMKECLQDQDLVDLMDAASEFPLIRSQLAFVNYNARVDGDFFEKDYPQLLQDAPQKPTMMGFNTHEAAFLTVEFPHSVMAFRGGLTVDTEEYENYNKSTFEEFIRNNAAKAVDELGAEDQAVLAEELIRFYTGEHANHSDWSYYLQQYTLLASDLAFIVPVTWEAKQRALAGSPVFLFQFDHVNSELKKELPFRAVVHTAEIPFIWGNHLFGSFEMNAADRKTQRRVVNTFANFIKSGSPNTPSMKWSPLEPGKPIRLAMLKSVPQFSRRADAMRRVNFWTDLDKDFEVDIVRGVRRPSALNRSNALEVRRMREAAEARKPGAGVLIKKMSN